MKSFASIMDCLFKILCMCLFYKIIALLNQFTEHTVYRSICVHLPRVMTLEENNVHQRSVMYLLIERL